MANFGHAADLDAANTARLHHIFDARLGHVPDSVANRQMLINTVNRSNYLGLDTHGNRWYASIRPDGKQIWVRVRNGEIINGGVNDIPKQWTPTGLK
ncbi:MAG: hypothetical protein JNL42_05720 [Anaerolineae bacterium]|nr:hypothetical protein [Anaerolineae bacterium]